MFFIHVACGDQKRSWDPLELESVVELKDGFESPSAFRPGSSAKQQVLLTREPSLQPLFALSERQNLMDGTKQCFNIIF